MYGSDPPWTPPDAACIPFRAPFADAVVLFVPLVGADEPWACACVVCAGEFCDENLELMLVIQELRREFVLPSGGVLPVLSVLLRPSKTGRLLGIFWGAEAVVGSTEGNRAGRGDVGCCCCCCCCWWG